LSEVKRRVASENEGHLAMFNLFTRKKGHVAHMGDENKFYFNEELNRWVERGKENEVTQETLPPPPTASSSATTQTLRDRADPASRYVVAGGFGRSGTPPTDAVKSFSTPPKLTSTPPPTGGFFVPPTTQTASEATTEMKTQDSAKYKGFRIPPFEKPDEIDGTQEEYEASELQKWKAKIDKREARKNNGVKSETTQENGISHLQKTGSGKLEDNWLFDSPGESAFDSQPFLPVEEKQQLNGFDRTETPPAFLETSSQMPTGMVEPLKSEGDPVDLFAVESEMTPEVGHTFSQPPMPMQNQMPYAYPPQNEAAEWFSSEQQQEGFDDDPVDFDTWGNPEENEQLAETLQSHQEIPQSESTTEAQPTQEYTYVEPDYPGAIRETDDPYDFAWMLQSGWTDPDQCRAITAYLCQIHQNEWRSWHKDDPQWDAFWTWYYDAGYDVIHSGLHQEQDDAQDFQTSYQGTEVFDLGMEQEFPEHQLNGLHIRPYPEQDSQETPSSMSQHLETVPEEPENLSNEEDTSEQSVPESDDEIWKIPDDETADQPEELVQSPVVPNAVPEIDFEQAESPEILNQDPFVDSPSSEDGTDDGKLPFAIFNHNGMLQFLMKLSSFLTELLQNNHADMSPATTHLQHQIRDLIKTVELSGQMDHSLKSVNLEETEILKQELEIKTQELESLRYRLSQEEAEWSNKMETARQEADQMQEAMTSMEDCLQQQEGRMHELVTKLGQTESELTSNKQQLADLRAQLDNKDDQMRDLMGNIADEKVKLEALRDQFKMEGGNNVIPRETPEEVENLRQEIESLQDKLAERSELPVNGVTASEVNSELEARVMSLQKELLQHQTALEVKEEEIEQLRTASEGNGFSVNNNETGEFLERLKEMEVEIDMTKQLLLAKDSQIVELQKNLELKSRELEALSFIGVQTTEKESDSDLASELEMMERKFTRLEQDLHDKDADFQRLSVMLESLHKKDAVISKLTAVLGEKDQELLQARAAIHEGRNREAHLIESISSKDVDLENVVRSLLFSQKQVSRLSEYCGQLGGDAHQLLSTLQVVE